MRQRVGYARAIVARADVLLMDEPFSALDVLTSETPAYRISRSLGTTPAANQIRAHGHAQYRRSGADVRSLLILSSNPARIATEIAVTLPRPRDRLDEEFGNIVDDVYAVLTARTVASLGALRHSHEGLAQPLPPAAVNRLNGLIEICRRPLMAAARNSTNWLNRFRLK